MRKYTARVTNNIDSDYEIDGYAVSPQEFHKIVLNEHINYQQEEILFIFNEKGKKVFNYRRGFSGS